MKRAILAVLGALALASAAQAVVVSERDVVLPVDISTAKVKLSKADYSSPVVKVLVPALADVTLLNHRNNGEGAPCLATYETWDPKAVIQNNPLTEPISFHIKLERYAYKDGEKCHVDLIETIEGKIRGFVFEHQRSTPLPERHIDDCR